VLFPLALAYQFLDTPFDHVALDKAEVVEKELSV
jgi:hypothetical protein